MAHPDHREEPETMALKKSEIATLPPGLHHDGDSLYLQVAGAGGGSWVFKYAINGRKREMGLGRLKDVPIEAARKKRAAAALLKASGVDPLEARRADEHAKKTAVSTGLTFREAAERYLVTARAGWANEVHRKQVEDSLEDYAYPVLGNLPLVQITREHVLEVLRDIWLTKAPTARRVRQRISSVFEHAAANDSSLKIVDPAGNMLAFRLALGKQIKSKKHYPSLPFAEVPAFMSDLRKSNTISARALEVIILTALRVNEAVEGAWSEINFKARTWTIPGERMKNGEEHVVPLSDRVFEILLDLYARREAANTFIFSKRTGRPITRLSPLKVIRCMGQPIITVHGFRASFRTWAGAMTEHARETAEHALSHLVGSQVERAYNHGKQLEKRRALMNDWANYCMRSTAPDNVVRLKTA
jgi:integrase